MKILGISLGHDSNFSLVEDGHIIAMMEAERYFRKKRYKLSAQTLETGKTVNTYQYTDIEDLKLFLRMVQKEWGASFDAVSVQNQGRKQEYDNLLIVLKEEGFIFEQAHHIDHHLSHAALSYFTSPFKESLVLSYDGIGNDGKTVFFSAKDNKIEYLEKNPICFGQSYNNLGYIIGISPEIDGTTSGKTMGLTSYGKVQESWIPFVQRYIEQYQKLPSYPVEGLRDHGKGHRINAIGIEDIPELKKYLVESKNRKTFKERIKVLLGKNGGHEMRLPGPEHIDSHNLAATVQHVWTQEVMKLLEKYRSQYKNLCLVGGCALNGTTNYEIARSGYFDKVHLIPNPSDCGLSGGAALYAYYALGEHVFTGLNTYYSPYLGSIPFDLDQFDRLKREYPHREVSEQELPKVLAKLVFENKIVGIVRGRYEVGPRALGNRSILCNPLNKDMRDILNDKVKHREWYRPFAPMVTEEDSKKYFTNTDNVPYMSVICDTRPEYRDCLPSITHIDGSARIQTIHPTQNPFIYKSLKEFEGLSGMPIFLNTSFNPGGEPILNFCEVALTMLKETDLDLVIIDNVVFSSHAKQSLLETL